MGGGGGDERGALLAFHKLGTLGRRGAALGEGAAFFVLEPIERRRRAARRSSREIAGYGTAFVAARATKPRSFTRRREALERAIAERARRRGHRRRGRRRRRVGRLGLLAFDGAELAAIAARLGDGGAVARAEGDCSARRSARAARWAWPRRSRGCEGAPCGRLVRGARHVEARAHGARDGDGLLRQRVGRRHAQAA